MALTLSVEVQAAIAEQVRAGKFESAEAAVAFGVSIVDGLSADQLEKLRRLRQDIAQADQDVAAGRVRSMRVQDAAERAQAIRATRQRQ